MKCQSDSGWSDRFVSEFVGGGVEEIGDFWYNIGIKENEIREYD